MGNAILSFSFARVTEVRHIHVCKSCAYHEKLDWNFHLILYSLGTELLFIFYDTTLHTYGRVC